MRVKSKKSPGQSGTCRGQCLARNLASFLALSVALVFSLPPFVLGQLPSARLWNVTPSGGKIGTTIEVTVSGSDLDGAKELRFSQAGITATTKGTNRFEVTIAREVPPGIHDALVVGKYGASNPRAFVVGVLAEVAEAKNSSDGPQTVALESTINGRSEANAIDSFLFQVKQGQRVLVRCEAREIDSKLEPVLELWDSAGREVSRSRTGGLLDYTAPADGEFTVRLHDLTYRGGPEFFYRLSLGTFPYVDFVQPISGGPKSRFAVFGRNLPGGKVVDEKVQPALEHIEVELAAGDPALTRPLSTMPAQAGLDLFDYHLRHERGVSDAVLLRLPTSDVLAEQEPNNTAATARKLIVPCEVAGRFLPNGDRDWFSFEAKKGDVYWVEVISQRLGLPTDPLVIVQRAGTNGATDVLELNDSPANIGGAEFNTTHRDPSGRWEVKEDGAYLVQVRDLFTQPQRTPALVYQLVIRKPSPDFRLVALSLAPLPKKDAKDVPVATTSLRRGETMALKVLALRRDGFDGAIELAVENLPKGVFASPGRIEAGKNSGLLLLHASGGAAGSAEFVKIRGTASVGGTNLTREARATSLTWPVSDAATEPAFSRVGANCVVSVMEETFPLRLSAAEDKTWETAAGSKIKIPLKLERDGEFTASWKLKPVGVAGLEPMKEFDFDPKSTNAVCEIDLGQQKLAPGSYTFALQGLAVGRPMTPGKNGTNAPGKEVTFTMYSAPITLQVNPAPQASTNSPAK